MKHLSSGHNLQLGHPHNLVFIDAMLDKLQSKLDQMLCIYCHKKFIDWFVLKEHMRKKQHKRVNPKDSSYDRFYVVNYLERGKDWHDIQSEKDYEEDFKSSNLSEDEEVSLDACGDWSDWQEDDDAQNENKVHCLFCTWKGADLVSVIAHMREDHCGFDLLNLEDKRFYSMIKVVNCIRRKVQEGCCIVCDWPGSEAQKDIGMKSIGSKQNARSAVNVKGGKKEEEAKREALLKHMTEASHFACPNPKLWDWPEYFFPTYENDALLYVLGELCDEDGDEENQQEMLQNMMGLLSCDSTENQTSEPNISSNI
ncbi:hypothetical protein J437_LFUL012270 [Ladona fulva]|uniref:C2H2-type domain-containing protein n=1 Tax=Ladona fulva TaxID=123851 RepID=A0A8K0K9E7_LADFU|nr:hypothetical protein J437_LFUL012270 [Ladona fulva]